MGRWRSEAGAAAVEFALVVPLLVLLALGTAELARAYNAQVSLSAAAREGARVMAIHNDPAAARAATRDAAPSLNPALADNQINVATVPLGGCVPGGTVTITASYPLAFVTGLFGVNTSIALSGTGVMRCNG